MRSRSGQAQAWLFAFVDLAFLMLVVMTQVGDTMEMKRADLGEIALPRLQKAAASDLPGHAALLWQLRVHPPRGDAEGPYELIAAENSTDAAQGGRNSLDTLGARLDEIRAAGHDRPLLAPHRRSESQHLLDAVAALEERWPSRRRTAVTRLARN